MSDPENFLTRWSRRKRNAAEETAAETDAAQDTAPTPDAGKKEAEAFDPASLPPIESLEPGSDIRAFLQKNVPADLTRAALRRAWVADPAIRDFVGLSEMAWDFNAPNSIPGFGPLEMTDELRQTVADLFSKQPSETTKIAAPAVPSSIESVQTAEPKEISAEPATSASEDDARVTDESSREETVAASDTAEQHGNIATQQDRPRESAERPATRGHGRALPR